MLNEVKIKMDTVEVFGHLSVETPNPKAWVIFAHGSGSSRHSVRNNKVAQYLNRQGLGTFLFDLLTEEEDKIYLNRFNIPLLGERLSAATEWLMNSHYYHGENIGYFGASTGAAAALMAAAEGQFPIYTIISRGGRPDLAGINNLKGLGVPVLLIVGGHDYSVIELNEDAQKHLLDSKLVIIPGATHLFEEKGALEEVMRISANWFVEHLSENQLIASRFGA